MFVMAQAYEGSDVSGQATLAERIRRFAFEHYVAPVRDASKPEIRIRAGDVHKAMGLSGRMPAVCGALDSMIFRREFGLELLQRTGPAQGANVEFIFRAVGEKHALARPSPGEPTPRSMAEVQAGSEAAPLSPEATVKLKFTLRGKTFEKEMYDFIRAMVGRTPGGIQKYSIIINDEPYPIRQVVACTTGLPSIAITSQDAYRILEIFGFTIETHEGETAHTAGRDGGTKLDAEDLLLEPEADDLFQMANLFPRTTGLPVTVWVSPRGNARHDVRVKVNMTPEIR
jgi:hypothetical protein